MKRKEVKREIKKIFGKTAKLDNERFNRLNSNKTILSNVERHKPIIYQLYEYLKNNALGYEKRIKSNVLMKEFKISDNKTLRAYIQEIRQSDILQKIICSESGLNGGYWVATKEEEIEETLNHLYKRSMEMLKTYSIIKRKAKLNNQYRLKLSKYEKELYESIIGGNL